MDGDSVTATTILWLVKFGGEPRTHRSSFCTGEDDAAGYLANQLGTVRERISRNLMRLQAEGLLDVDARQIVVKDMNGLMALLDSPS